MTEANHTCRLINCSYLGHFTEKTVAEKDIGQPLSAMSKSIILTTPPTFELGAQTQPILPSWVISGAPVSRTWNVARSHDLMSNIVVWECTAGRFEWHYSNDETIMVVSGEVFITNEKGEERRLGPGDLGFFPSGTSCTWRVPERVRKISVLREPMWRPLGLGLKIWKTLLRIAGMTAVRLAGAGALLRIAVAEWTPQFIDYV